MQTPDRDRGRRAVAPRGGATDRRAGGGADETLMVLLAGGHALLIGVPGLAKTLMIRSVAEACTSTSGASSSRPT